MSFWIYSIMFSYTLICKPRAGIFFSPKDGSTRYYTEKESNAAENDLFRCNPRHKPFSDSNSFSTEKKVKNARSMLDL